MSIKPVDLAGSEYPEIIRRLEQLGMLADRAFLVEALGEFEAGIREQIAILADAVAADDRTRVERASHRIAGSSKTLGAIRLGARAAELEHRCPAERAEKLVDLARAVMFEAGRVLEFVATLVAPPADSATIRRAR